jgi:hypothetical protein
LAQVPGPQGMDLHYSYGVAVEELGQVIQQHLGRDLNRVNKAAVNLEPRFGEQY